MGDIPPDRLTYFPNTIFNKHKEKVLSNDANFLDSTGLKHGSCGKKNRETGIAGFDITNQTSTQI